MKIVLVHMPWGAPDVPSLALGIVAAAARRRGHDVHIRYANLDFIDWVVQRTPFSLGDYRYFAESSYFQGAGDWVFATAMDGADRDLAAFAPLLAGAGAGPAEIALTGALRELVPEFVSALVDDLAADAPDLVGFTTTFQQNTASLAAARLIAERCPGTRTVFGGANCEGPQGAALHRNFGFLDFVVRGEGEVAFPMLLDALAAGSDDLAAVPSLCWRDGSGAVRVNPMAPQPLPASAIHMPEYGDFFERLDTSAAASWVEPKLVVEGSRGCWWGEKHHCTFCGLNGSLMQYRSKSPDRFTAELIELARRHQLLDFFVVDNILDMGYFDSVLRDLAESEYDLRLHFEVKANLRRRHFQRLAEAGAVQVQPGVESLSTRVLRLMDKGVTGAQNVRALRDAQSAGVTTSWNYLYGFPGETDEDYRSVIDQLPALSHLDPPTGAARIVVERFSPYFDRPDLGFSELAPAPHYRQVYRLPDEELTDLAYLFVAAPQGIDNTTAATLDAAIETWRDGYPRSRLTYTELPGRTVLVSDRAGYDWSVLELDTDAELTMFRLLDQPRGTATLAERVPGGATVATALLARWQELGMVFGDDGHYVHTAVESDNQLLWRVDHWHARAAAAGSVVGTGAALGTGAADRATAGTAPTVGGERDVVGVG